MMSFPSVKLLLHNKYFHLSFLCFIKKLERRERKREKKDKVKFQK